MIQSLLIANRDAAARRIIRNQFLPGTGRGTAKRWRGSRRVAMLRNIFASVAPYRKRGGI